MKARSPMAVWIYAVLLKAYPYEFRSRYGDEMLCVFEESWSENKLRGGAAWKIALLVADAANLIATAARKRVAQLGNAICIQQPISLAASLLLHATVAFSLTWLAFHPLPPPGDSCDVKPNQETIVRISSVTAAHATRSR